MTASSPFQIADFWTEAKPGVALCLLDGTYRGGRSMIIPPANLEGEPGNPITIKALNDGYVDIDGEGERWTVRLINNDWFVLEGFNAHDAYGGNWHASVVMLSRSDHNIIRRVVGWDAQDGNTNIFGIHNSEFNLLEDVAGFGIARKIFSSSQNGNHTTIRRAWGRWEGSHFVGPKMTYTLAYNNYDMLVENAIGTWSAERMQETYQLQCNEGTSYSKCDTTFTNYAVDQPYAVFGIDRLDGDKNARTKLLGSLAYITESDRFHPGQVFFTTKLDSVEYKDVVSLVDIQTHGDKRTFGLYSLSGGGGENLVAGNITSIGGNGAYITSYWQVSNLLEAETINDAYQVDENVFNTSRGANLCYRYQDGVLTDDPLWPWPMDQRIYDAMFESGHTPFYVTEVVEGMFGTIPEECRSDNGPAPSPTFVDVPYDHWAHDLIEILYQQGYIAGCSSDPLMYCPEASMTRAESAVFIESGIHGAGYLPEQPTSQVFDDVPRYEWYAKWANGLWEDGYTAGCGTDPLIYCPLRAHTRTEGTVFFLRMLHGADYIPGDPVGIFVDVPLDFWGAKWIEAAYVAGLIPECETEPNLRFCPDDFLDRAMGAYMMVQAKGLSVP